MSSLIVSTIIAPSSRLSLGPITKRIVSRQQNISTTTVISAAVVSSLLPAEENIGRQSANYHPSVWGDSFISYQYDDKLIHAWRKEADILKEKVREMLINNFSEKSLGEKLNLIDVIQRLGITYHFEGEIKEFLEEIFSDHVGDNDLYTSSLRFRLLREHGHNVSCDIFNKFKDNKGTFKEALTRDVWGLLSLYEATHLRMHGEAILDEALIFSTRNLQSMLSTLKPYIAKQVLHALRRPIRRSVTRLEALEYFTFYQESKSHNEVLLRFGKLDFNILQKQHQEELSIIVRWWNNLDFKTKLPFARDRVVEGYFWVLGTLYEPQYALARKFTIKVLAMTTVIDDIYDVYGTTRELELFTEAVERWEISAMDKLPEYMKICYQALLDMYDEMEEEMEKEENSCYGKEAMKDIVKAYHEESKWLHSSMLPTMEEYMKVALVSIGTQLMVTTLLAGMGNIATKETFNWLVSRPRVLQAICLISRLMDDISSHKHEQERKHIPSAVECYKNQYGVSDREVCDELNKQIIDAWKDINEAFLNKPKGVSMSFIMCLLNLSRVIDLLYKHGDFYTNPGIEMKHYITHLLITPVQIQTFSR